MGETKALQWRLSIIWQRIGWSSSILPGAFTGRGGDKLRQLEHEAECEAASTLNSFLVRLDVLLQDKLSCITCAPGGFGQQSRSIIAIFGTTP